MNTMIINGSRYELHQCDGDLLEWVEFAKINRYTKYYNKLVYKNKDGVFACYTDDQLNYLRI